MGPHDTQLHPLVAPTGRTMTCWPLKGPKSIEFLLPGILPARSVTVAAALLQLAVFLKALAGAAAGIALFSKVPSIILDTGL